MKKRLAFILMAACLLLLLAGCSQNDEKKEGVSEYDTVKAAAAKFEKLKSGKLEAKGTFKMEPLNEAAKANSQSNPEENSSEAEAVFQRKSGDRYEYIINTLYTEEGRETGDSTDMPQNHQIEKQIDGTRSYGTDATESTDTDEGWTVTEQDAWGASGLQLMMDTFLYAEDVEDVKVVTEGALTKYTFYTGENYRIRMRDMHSPQENYLVNSYEESFWIDQEGLLVRRASNLDLDMSTLSTQPETGDVVELRYHHMIADDIKLTSHNEKVVIE